MIIKDRQDLKNMRDMLDGNLNRMSTTEDIEMLETMFDYAKIRLQAIYNYQRERVINNVK
jgi:hypothetical protein